MNTTSAQPGTEREQLLAMLRRSADSYLAAMAEIPEGVVSAKPDANSWSAIELAEHIAVAEHGMFRLIEMGAPKTTPVQFDRDAWVREFVPNRSKKAQAPERSHPKGRWKTIPEATEAFKQARTRSIEFAENPVNDLRRIEVGHPLFGPLDAHQMLMVMSGHVERHLKQLEEIKQCPAYLAALQS